MLRPLAGTSVAQQYRLPRWTDQTTPPHDATLLISAGVNCQSRSISRAQRGYGRHGADYLATTIAGTRRLRRRPPHRRRVAGHIGKPGATADDYERDKAICGGPTARAKLGGLGGGNVWAANNLASDIAEGCMIERGYRKQS
jgi:hypothetical protein